jgi:hypothetical protein
MTNFRRNMWYAYISDNEEEILKFKTFKGF